MPGPRINNNMIIKPLYVENVVVKADQKVFPPTQGKEVSKRKLI